jgi:murein DD-endopeptidase MepM/ murein hydrolase activator NlpD
MLAPALHLPMPVIAQAAPTVATPLPGWITASRQDLPINAPSATIPAVVRRPKFRLNAPGHTVQLKELNPKPRFNFVRPVQPRLPQPQPTTTTTPSTPPTLPTPSTEAIVTTPNPPATQIARPITAQDLVPGFVPPAYNPPSPQLPISEWVYPLSEVSPVSSRFGWRIHPIHGSRRFHAGLDLAADTGTPVVASNHGYVSLAGRKGGYGLTVMLDHGDGTVQTLYGHLSEIGVQQGQMVQAGQMIGRVGSTGNSTGPHLHFEIRQWQRNGWQAVDPEPLVKRALSIGAFVR